MRKRLRRPSRASLGYELLEDRSLLAGLGEDIFYSPWQNPLDPNDLDNDGFVTASDALAAINTINGGKGGDLSASMAPPTLLGFVKSAASDFFDADGDGSLSASDALRVINTINQGTPRGPLHNLPDTDQHADSINPDPAGPAIGDLELSRGFAKVLAAINTAGDVDVFRVVPEKSELNVTLFSAGRKAMTVSVVVVDPIAPGGIATLATATTEDDSRRPAKVNLEVETGVEHFVIVKGAAADTTGVYGLGVLNYSPEQFTPITDSELGDDKHGATPATATPLMLKNNIHALVRSNIDAAGDADSFLVEAAEGKLIVHAGAEFDLSLEVVQLDDMNSPVGSPVTGDR